VPRCLHGFPRPAGRLLANARRIRIQDVRVRACFRRTVGARAGRTCRPPSIGLARQSPTGTTVYWYVTGRPTDGGQVCLPAAIKFHALGHMAQFHLFHSTRVCSLHSVLSFRSTYSYVLYFTLCLVTSTDIY